MIDIVTLRGERYSYDPDTFRIFKNNELIPDTIAEPVFSDAADGEPEFSGIYLKPTNQIISRSGKINTVDNPDIL